MLICRDISKIKENSKLQGQNKMLSLMSSSISHEMLTPIKCIIKIVEDIGKIAPKECNLDHNIELVVSTAQMLLSQVKGNLDRHLLDKNFF